MKYKIIIFFIILLAGSSFCYAKNIQGCEYNNSTNFFECTEKIHIHNININKSIHIFNATIYGNGTNNDNSYLKINTSGQIIVENSILNGYGMKPKVNGNIDLIAKDNITIINSTLNYKGGRGISYQCSGSGYLNINTDTNLNVYKSNFIGYGVGISKTARYSSNYCHAGGCNSLLHANNIILNKSNIQCYGGDGTPARHESGSGGHGNIIINAKNKFEMISDNVKRYLNAYGGRGANE